MCHEWQIPSGRGDPSEEINMRAGRLLNLLLLLQNGQRTTAAKLAEQLEVSERTVLRDIETLGGLGVPVYAVRGPNGGFELLETFNYEVPPLAPGLTSGPGRLRRVRVRVSPAALQTASLTGKPAAWRPRPNATPDPDHPDWVEGSFRFDSYDSALRELLSLAPEVEILLPSELRDAMAVLADNIADMHRHPTDG